MAKIEKLATRSMRAISAVIRKTSNIAPFKIKPVKNGDEKIKNTLDGLSSGNYLLVEKANSKDELAGDPHNQTLQIGQNELKLNIIKDKNGRKFIKPFKINYNGKIQLIFPFTYIQDGQVGYFKLMSQNGSELNSELNTDFISDLQKKSTRNLLTNYDIFSSSGIIYKAIELIPPKAKLILKELKKVNPEKYNLVIGILKNTFVYSKTQQGVSEKYIIGFIEKLTECNEKLLKNAYTNNVKIKIYDDMALYQNASHAQYSQGANLRISNNQPVFDKFNIPIYDKNPNVAYIEFSERYNCGKITVNKNIGDTIESLPHELGHAFDSGMNSNFNLHPQDVITSTKDEEFSRFADSISYSKEFDEAFTKDIINMSAKDAEMGRKYGQTFEMLLKSPDFNYYLGVKDGNQSILFDDLSARKEMFAQMVSYVTSGHVTNKNFERQIEELFPNLLHFTRSLF